MDSEIALYAIKEVSEMTGVNSVTLRAWQRRYGLLNPQRTEQGHRLYSDVDIETIRQILGWLDKGVAISKVRPLLEGNTELAENPDSDASSQAAVDQLLQSLVALDAQALDRQVSQLMKEYPLDRFSEHIAAVVQANIHRSENPLAGVQSALWRSVIRERCLSLVAGLRKRNRKPCLLLGFDSVPEYGVWLTLLALSEQGYNVTLLTSVDGKLSALSALLKSWQERLIVVAGEYKLDRDVAKQLGQLVAETNSELKLAGSISAIHPELTELCHES